VSESLTNAASPAHLVPTGTIGTPFTAGAMRVVLLGAGELAKELAIELQRLGGEVVAVGSYAAAPAMQVADRGHVVDLLDPDVLLNVLAIERPHVVIPVAGALDPSVLGEIEDGGARVVPSALATQMSLDREIMRRLLAEDLGLPTPKYEFASSYPALVEALAEVGLPAVVKSVRSSAGSGHTVVRSVADAETAWETANSGGWLSADEHGDHEPRVIVEEYVPFDAELVVFVVRAWAPNDGEAAFACPAIQVIENNGFVAAWTPAVGPGGVSADVAERAQALALESISALPGWGVFAVEFLVEFLVEGDRILVSEVSPRPAGAGFVTMAAWDTSVFAMEARAVLGLPVSPPVAYTSAAARALWVTGVGKPSFVDLDQALATFPNSRALLFGKPNTDQRRAVAMVLATGPDAETARQQADGAAATINVVLDDGRNAP